MTLKKSIERLTIGEGQERIMISLFKELSESLELWNCSIDKIREEEAINKYRKVKNSILLISNESQYKLTISDVQSCNREVIANPQKEARRSFKFRF